MKDWKKFLAFGLTTVLAAGAVVFITPAVKSLAGSAGTYWRRNIDGSYTEVPEGEAQAGDWYTSDGDKYTQVTTKTPSGDNNTSDDSGSNPSGDVTKTTSPDLKKLLEAIAKIPASDNLVYNEECVEIVRNALEIYVGLSEDDIADLLIDYPNEYSKLITAAEVLDALDEYYTNGSTATKAQPSSGGGSSDGSGYGAVAAGELTSINADGQVVRTFVDLGGSKTMIAGADGIIPTGSKFFAIPAKQDSATYQAATTIMAHWRPAAQVKEVFDFNVMAKGGDYIHNLDGSVTMSLPVPEDLVVPDGSILVVYRFNPDGTVTPCETLIDKGRVVWGTDAFGTFAFVIEKIPTNAN